MVAASSVSPHEIPDPAIPPWRGSVSSMVIRSFEERLERLVEGAFARAFRSGIQPVEIGRRLVRALDDGSALDVNGTNVSPNHLTVALSPADRDRYDSMRDGIVAELSQLARSHTRDHGRTFVAPLLIELADDPTLNVGMCRVDAKFDETTTASSQAWLELPDGQRVVLGDHAVLGRLPESTVVINDASVSRRHAELHPYGDGHLLIDRGSTNGTMVNGRPIDECGLVDGDEIVCGHSISLIYRRN